MGIKPVRFGTSGWRGVLGEDFTFDRLRALAAAVGRHAHAEGGDARVLVTHDTRFLADRAAIEAARAISGTGARPLIAEGPTPTPVATHAVRHRRCAAGLLVTASHNPPEYLGVKVVAPWGGPAPRELTRWLEGECARQLELGPPDAGPGPGRRVRPGKAYLRDLARRLDAKALARSRVPVFYDALHGSGSGTLDRLLASLGVSVEVLRGEPDPQFGGGAPDPEPARLGELARRVARRGGRALGLATDGDADRLAVVDPRGRLSETEVIALLVDHLGRTRSISGGVAISVATGSLVERVAGELGLEVKRHPIGFRPLTEALVGGDATLAGDESGGFAWAPFTHDKDGILAAMLVVEMASGMRGTLRGRLAELERRHGSSACGRRAVPLDDRQVRAVERLASAPPRRFDGSRVRAEKTPGGVVLGLEDGFAVLRCSGTEPVVRLYAEAPGRVALEGRLAAAARLLTRAGR
jgi:phosphoglucomutase